MSVSTITGSLSSLSSSFDEGMSIARGYSAALLFAALVVSNVGCEAERGAFAKRVTNRSELIGGPGALGEVGDFLLANRQVRFIIQNEGFSRGFGIYGGALIDADLQRPSTFGDSSGGRGFDNFSELFPGLFLKAMRPTSITAENHADGSASVVVTGAADEFLFLASRVNDLLLDGPSIIFRNEYKLAPGRRYVEITTTITNGSADRRPIAFPDDGARSLLGDTPFVFPVGDVLLFGVGNDVFAPGAGFDLRFALESRLSNPAPPPVLPGLVTPLLATRGHNVSYGFLSGATAPERSLITRSGAAGNPGDLIVPFIASAFTGAYYGAPPESLPFAESYSYTKYFIVGDGDVASIRDVAFGIRGTSTSTVVGLVLDDRTSAPEAGAEIVVLNADGEPYNHHRTDSGGRFEGRYEPGSYRYVVLTDGRFPTVATPFVVEAGRSADLIIRLEPQGEVAVRITDERGRLMPGRCSLVTSYSVPMGTMPGRAFLYDLRFGERIRPLDAVPDSDDPQTRRFIEEVITVPGDGASAIGRGQQRVRPGRYRAYCSRGPEYSLFEQDIVVLPGGTATVDAVLRRALDTTGWASGDFHLHAVNSVDSAMSLERRVAAVAAEGVDLAVSTDHNYITDYRQAIASQRLDPFVQSMIGLELTTIESGHFNGFPLRFDPEPITNGAFEWSGRPPHELFDALRARGALGPEKTIVQINHPRDSILGYFDNYNFNQDTGLPEDAGGLIAPTQDEFQATAFSFEFDAIEVFNGKRIELLRNQRVPEVLPPGVTFEEVGPAGSIYRTSSGDIGFPGGMDDWFALLDRGRYYTATGNSDSHGPDDEPGVPRTYVPVSDDRPGHIDPIEVVAALKQGRAIVTTGPLPLISVQSDASCISVRTGTVADHRRCTMGELAQVTDGAATVEVEVRVPSWQPVSTLRLVANGTVAAVRGLTGVTETVTINLALERDTWVIAEVAGNVSLFPIVRPNEIPAIQVSAALESVVGAFGLGAIFAGGPLPPPSELGPVFSYGFTNPVFIDVDGNGRFDARLAPGPAGASLTGQRARRETGRLPPQIRRRREATLLDVFNAFGHGH